MLFRTLGDLRVVLQDQGDPDGADQRCQSGGVAQRFVGDTFNDPTVNASDDHGEDQGAENEQWEGFDAEVSQQCQTDRREVSGNHINLAMGEVDHANDAIDHCVADGDQAIDRPEGQAVDQLLQENTIHNAISRGENLRTGGCAVLLEEKTDLDQNTVPLWEGACPRLRSVSCTSGG